jgi:hypothetical protein
LIDTSSTLARSPTQNPNILIQTRCRAATGPIYAKSYRIQDYRFTAVSRARKKNGKTVDVWPDS